MAVLIRDPSNQGCEIERRRPYWLDNDAAPFLPRVHLLIQSDVRGFHDGRRDPDAPPSRGAHRDP